jgi:hypothetical protein
MGLPSDIMIKAFSLEILCIILQSVVKSTEILIESDLNTPNMRFILPNCITQIYVEIELDIIL